MSDVKLSSGREITFDLYKMTVREWDRMFDKDQLKEEDRATLAKCAGLTVEEIADLLYPDLRRLYDAFFKRCGDPLGETP